jgi:hypothetical protein
MSLFASLVMVETGVLDRGNFLAYIPTSSVYI